MKVLAFAGSNSQQSINRQLLSYVSRQMSRIDVQILDLNDYEMPLFSIDRERAFGDSPAEAYRFFKKITDADGVMISFAEHNGSYSVAYKNLFDWTSRIDRKVYQGKPMALFATSPGPGGGRNVLSSATSSLPHFGGNVVASLSIPRFSTVFDVESSQVTDESTKAQIVEVLTTFTDAISQARDHVSPE
ncbi:MAG: NAD(P)H-dependent oxidoreductase [Pseudomonadota bacterium]